MATERPLDALTLLKNDHAHVETLFRKFEATSDRATKTRRRLVDQIITALSVHAAIEEQLFYPALRDEVPEVDPDVLEALEEHHIVKWQLHELEDSDAADERFGAKVTVLIEHVRHHVDEEEKVLFPQVRRVVSRSERVELGSRLAEAKSTAPTHPHPRAPQTPPANLVVGAAAGLADRAHDLGKEAVDRLAFRAADVVGR